MVDAVTFDVVMPRTHPLCLPYCSCNVPVALLYELTLVFMTDTSNDASSRHATAFTMCSHLIEADIVYVLTSHTLAVLSSEAQAKCVADGEREMDLIASAWASIILICAPVSAFQTCTLPFRLPVTTIDSVMNVTALQAAE